MLASKYKKEGISLTHSISRKSMQLKTLIEEGFGTGGLDLQLQPAQQLQGGRHPFLGDTEERATFIPRENTPLVLHAYTGNQYINTTPVRCRTQEYPVKLCYERAKNALAER